MKQTKNNGQTTAQKANNENTPAPEIVTLEEWGTCPASCWCAYNIWDCDNLKKWEKPGDRHNLLDVCDTEDEARDDMPKMAAWWQGMGCTIEYQGRDFFTWTDRQSNLRHLHFICPASTDWTARAAELLATIPANA